MKKILVHGGPGLSNYWPLLFSSEELADFTHFELPKAENIEDYTEALVQHMGDETCVLIGHSFGGTLVLESLKHMNKNQVAGVVLVSTPLSFHVNDEFQNEVLQNKIDPNDPLQVFLSSEEQADPKCGEKLAQIFENFDANVLNKINTTYMSKFNLQAVLESLGACHVVYGSEDHRVPVRHQQSGASLNHHLQSHCIQGAGHFPFLLKRHQLEFLNLINRLFRH